MARRTSALLCAVLFLFAACSSDKKTSTSSGASTSGGGEVVTVQVGGHGTDAATNFDATKYYPDALTVAAGSTVRFKEALGEPHTVSFGTSIDTIAKYVKDHPDALNGPPPQEIQDLKVPFFFPFPESEGPPKIRQAVAQPCVLGAGEFAADDGLPACSNTKAGTLDGKASILNSGLFIEDGQSYDLKIADDLAPGTYTWICQFHGPEMHGSLTVVPKGDKSAQSAADVETARKKALDADLAEVKSAVDKAKADAKPGEVKAAPAPQDSPLYAGVFSPAELDIKAGDAVTWNLSFHTVTFNAPEDAHLFLTKQADGSIVFNDKAINPAGYTPPPTTEPPSTSPPDTSSAASGGGEQTPPPPTYIDGGTWDGTGFYNSGSANAEGDVFFTLKFTKAGTYKYICTIHPDMEGTIKVS